MWARRRGRHHPARRHPGDPVDPGLAGRPADVSTGWLGALRDPQLGAAITAVHREPGRPWTVATLGARGGDVPVGVLRAVHGGRRRARDAVRHPDPHARRSRPARATGARPCGRWPPSSATTPRRPSAAPTSGRSGVPGTPASAPLPVGSPGAARRRSRMVGAHPPTLVHCWLVAPRQSQIWILVPLAVPNALTSRHLLAPTGR